MRSQAIIAGALVSGAVAATIGCGDAGGARSGRPGAGPSSRAEAPGASAPRDGAAVPADDVDVVARRIWAAAAAGDGEAFCDAMTTKARKLADEIAKLFGQDCTGQIAESGNRTAEKARRDAEALSLDVAGLGRRRVVRFSDAMFGELVLTRVGNRWRLADQQGDGVDAGEWP